MAIMMFIHFLCSLLIDLSDLTPQEIGELKARIANRLENIGDAYENPQMVLPPAFAPIVYGESFGGVPPIGDKSYTGGGSDGIASEGATRPPRFESQKRCLCGPECQRCSGDCHSCDCIFEPLPPPGPGPIKWQTLKTQR